MQGIANFRVGRASYVCPCLVLLVLIVCLTVLHYESGYNKLLAIASGLQKSRTSFGSFTGTDSSTGNVDSFLDSLVAELKESKETIALYSDMEKVPETAGKIICNFHDKELDTRKCSPGDRKSCIQDHLSTNLKRRVEDLVLNENLRISPEHREAINELERQVKGHYDLVIVSALSSNHYLESQAMLQSLNNALFKYVTDVKVIVYDIGLTDEEHENYKKYCGCQLIKFPFEKFPPHCRTLKCFCWKAIVTRAHLSSGNTVMWIDASVRFVHPEIFPEALQYTKLYGVQQNRRMKHPRIPTRALPQMFHHFGFTPCVFMPYSMAGSNWGIYRNSPLIQYAVLDSWVGCGLNRTCTCPGSIDVYLRCPQFTERNRYNVGICQRPQSAVALILSRLWMEDYLSVANIQNSFRLWRNHKVKYFDELEKSGWNGTQGEATAKASEVPGTIEKIV